MKKSILFIFVALGSLTLHAQEIKWMTLDEAVAEQKKNPKPIFMDVYTDWCGPCKMLDKNTFHDKTIVDFVSKNYYAVKFNAEGNSVLNFKGVKYTNPGFMPDRTGRNSPHEFGRFLQIQGYPTMYVLDVKGEITANLVGYRTPEELLPELKK